MWCLWGLMCFGALTRYEKIESVRRGIMEKVPLTPAKIQKS